MEADWQSVHRYASDPEVVRYMSWGPNTEEETKGFIQRALAGQNERPRRNYTLAIVVRNENELIGSCSICVSNLDNREGWIGYCLNRCFWGKGYATETANALVDFGFDKLNLHRIFATCDPANNRVCTRSGEDWNEARRSYARAHVGKGKMARLFAIRDPRT
ncbi:MAG: GNAT family N-acetyltransferase [Candidatus Bathyarchaeia archaeon]|jgi:RimJ/RimL family protein N-acetyltransferase